jgi:diguanylate cyclase (GGDEF)-like protein/PAS domain S-box-containing protein
MAMSFPSGLRTRIFATTASLVIILSGVVGFVSIQLQRSALEHEVMTRASTAARHLAYGSEPGLLARDETRLWPFLLQLLDEKSIRFAAVYRLDGRLLAGSTVNGDRAFQKTTPLPEPLVSRKMDTFCGASMSQAQPVYECWVRVEGITGRSAEDLVLGEPLVGVGRTLGYARVGMDLTGIAEATQAMINNVIGTLAILLLVALISAWVLARLVTTPLSQLRAAAARVENGDFSGHLETGGDDEMASLGRAFNRMQHALAEREGALRLSDERLKLATEASQVGLWDWNIATGEVYFTQEWLMMLGYKAGEVDPHISGWEERINPDDRGSAMRTLNEHVEGRSDCHETEYRMQAKDGSWVWVLDRGKVVERDAGGRPLRAVGTHTDLTERKKYEARIWHQAHYDLLTNLPNRILLTDRLQQAIATAHRQGNQIAVLYLDLDRFKQVNDTHGHALGDQVIQDMAHRLKDQLRDSDTLARLGGDEFAILLVNIEEVKDAEAVAAKLLKALSEPFHLAGGHVFHSSGSFGVAIYPHDGEDADTLLRNADTAMYRTKDQGGNHFTFFSGHMNVEVMRRHGIENDLRKALEERKEFSLYFQPFMDIESGQVVGAEGLVRWRHPTLGMVSPDRFIPVAEDSGLIQELGLWVLELAFDPKGIRSLPLPEGFCLTINVSARQFHDRGSRLMGKARELAGRSFGPLRLEFEITESLFMSENAHVAEEIRALKELGIGLAMDDFGTGYSALSYIKRFPIDSLKIDQSFIAGLPGNSQDGHLVRGIIAMANELGVRVVAEGIETRGQLDFLRAAGCRQGQGYYFCPPVPLERFAEFLNFRQGISSPYTMAALS